MCSIRNLKAASVLLIAAACLSPNSADAAKRPKTATTNAPRMQSKAKNIPKRITLRPRIIVQSAPAGKPGKLAKTAKTAKKPQPVTSVNRAIRANGSNLNNIAQRAKNIRTKVGEQTVRDLNSSSAGAIENAIPGFTGRGIKGAKGLKESGRTDNDRNPVTRSGDLGDFTGGGVGELTKGGKKNKDETATHHEDGSTTLFNKKTGVRTDVLEDGTIVVTPGTKNKSQTIYPGDGSPTWVYIPPQDGKNYDMAAYLRSQNKKGGTKGEPVDDPTGSGGSGEAVITAETLRGLRSRVSSRGEPTGDEATSGGPVDQSKTRQGRINQVGQPTDESPTVRSAPSAMEVNQAIRVRLRNVNPVPR